ncbi:NADH-quinone oxidoreductase subunit NuoE [Candidatus Aminicenantes bacterium AC-335-B20]|jgi:NADH:ubiquinone oxidoreductase subunit E|nr:NADH-quinone oxidoreductase subunit NuoE [SCandidatus Aminicenantes bacterium Aminicenantia_JdfR_composite]MCP2596605.1 NADH-quinone oxidoreductase subunit NuoE [Candidatus Aminicenantes bacterium AC-335-G13]MCP2598069.1 NADH-quinone oxidoreductase subunit NuoE [Candidatus Aminicenantes bacterium AC-335-L06]MCP2598963.1 NADH-quinone oxidoreductase subunit NuoE [Candidatus Aminicenantes bacterium AC-335-B20]MCP2605793.1 NADH-quinone oxidoreductase subunit NuoE [Candidatus Aminicenantes bacter
MNREEIRKILEKWERREDAIIEILHDIQNKYNYLPKDVLIEISKELDMPLSQICSVATFYNWFSLTPRGKHKIGVCMGTPCHVKGAPLIIKAIEKELGIKEGQTTKDLNFTLEITGCVGTCGLAPVVVIDGELYGDLNQNKILKILRKYKEGGGGKNA